MHLPIRLVRGGWPARVEAKLRRFVWTDPQIVLAPDAEPAAFTATMSALHLGGTIKITGIGRHSEGDALLLDHVELTDASVIVDVGASDGCTSLELIDKLPRFGAFILADLYFTISATRRERHASFYDRDGACILVCGPRLLAWPSTSRFVKALYGPLLRWIERSTERHEVTLLNPSVRARMGEDARITTSIHDVFRPWAGPRPDVIKIANLLRRIYFDDDTILAALNTVLRSLPPGGHLLVVDNPRGLPVYERAGLYRRDGDRFETIAEANGPPEIAELVAKAGECQLAVASPRMPTDPARP